MNLQRNDIIALVVAGCLGALAIFGKIDWTAAVAWVLGVIQKQPTIVAGPPQV